MTYCLPSRHLILPRIGGNKMLKSELTDLTIARAHNCAKQSKHIIYMPFLPDFENKNLFMVLFSLAIVVALIFIYKKLSKDINPYAEGFVQMQKFILKRDADTYDEFYAHIYDQRPL